MPVVVENVEGEMSRHVGYGGLKQEDVDVWLSESLEYFTDIYGTVVDAHYTVERVNENEEGTYDYILNIVVTGIVDSDGDFGDCVHDLWPADLVEQLRVATERVDMSGIVGYDLNPIQNDTIWCKFDDGTRSS